MWSRLIAAALAFGSLVGSATPLSSASVPHDNLGVAVQCEWRNQQPINCVIDATRVTINLEYLSTVIERLTELTDQLKQCTYDEYDRRKL